MPNPPRVTKPLLDVLEVFVAALDGDGDLHGWVIMKAAKRSGPTVYGILDRLEDMGWITGRWEAQNPDSNKPRRRFYQLTPTGRSEAMELLLKHRPQPLGLRVTEEPRPALPGWPNARPQGGIA